MTRYVTLLDNLPERQGWPTPLADAAIPMQSHAWMQARVTLAPHSRHHLIAVQTGQGLQAIAPLVRVGNWLREFPAMFEPSDLVWTTNDSLDELAGALASQPVPIFLERLPADSPTLAALRRAYMRRGIVLVRSAMPTPSIDLRGCSDISQIINAGRRSDLRRAERRARHCGPVSYEIHSPTSESDIYPLLSEAYKVESESWKSAAGTALTSDPVQGDFFVRFALAAGQDRSLRVAFLRIGDQPVAMQIALEWQRRFWLFKISHHRAYHHCSPGHLLLRHTLDHAITRGLRSYEFMGVMAGWTRLWTPECRRYVQVRAIPFSGTALRAAARYLAGKLYRRLRRPSG